MKKPFKPLGPLVGALLVLLSAPQAEAARYVVQEGDTLERLAARYLGSYTRWPEIVFFNPHLRREALKPGMIIEMPTGKSLPPIREIPFVDPSALPSVAPTSYPTATPELSPRPLPTATPTARPTPLPLPTPTPFPTSRPVPTPQPTTMPTAPAVVTKLVPPMHSQFWLNYQGWQYNENFSAQKLSASGNVTRGFQAAFLWRPVDFILVDLAYDFSFYQTSRVATSEQATRQQDHVRLGALGVWTLVPEQLEWALGANAEFENFSIFGPASGVVTNRATDFFDVPHQRIGAALRTRLAWRPIRQVPWEWYVDFGVQPFLAVQQKQALLPSTLFGVDSQIGTEFGVWAVGGQAAFFSRHHFGKDYTLGALGLRAGLGIRF